jgi:hypothetical protein
VAVNRLQSSKIGDGDTSTMAPRHGKATSADNADVITHATNHGHKLLLPTYDGTEDPLLWLNRCDQFFHIQETPDANKVFLAPFYTSGEASQWFSLLERNQGKSSREEFARLVNQRFRPPLWSNPLGELIQLRHDGTVAKYQRKFLSLLARYDMFAEKHLINVFTAGLCNPLKTDVELEYPATLEEGMVLARAYEQRLSMTDLPPVHSSPLPRSSLGRNPGSSRPLLLTTPSPAAGAEEKPPTAPRFKRLTISEMVAKREKGECYTCTQEFLLEQLKTCPMKGIYLLQLDDAAPADKLLLEADPSILLNAITGLVATDMMQFAVRLAGHTVGALIGSRSIHSFISMSVATCLHLDPLHQPDPHVKVANGDRVTSTGVFRATHIYIDKEEFVIDFFVISLEGFDMVLGV